MSPKKRRNYMTYQAILKKLTRHNVKQPGVVATLLLNAFVPKGSEEPGIITAFDVQQAGLIQEGQFKQWRDELIRKGWLTYDYEYAKARKKGSLHGAGVCLIPYNNKQNMKKKQLVTMDCLSSMVKDIVHKEIQKLNLATEEQVEYSC
jgi:hypothetical protein